ncbi:hypothetical protein Ae168Ps1_1116c [Pseudonocardia sp. Ae168_Ps1]|nr:hypothetical protein Ae168Ps1_1116c [Pseudonocardia sp. Ae168_Ps1]OLL87162.1 hypothetical protein Ae263Ps1_4217 [Pseudonocardia sp. Ae263_Ps1]OLL92808.1 hypothetical protein Ae356Ps1_2705c [Pseudonocardia sp. Ae356_Ps1]
MSGSLCGEGGSGGRAVVTAAGPGGCTGRVPGVSQAE